jgi:hypothetical protein
MKVPAIIERYEHDELILGYFQRKNGCTASWSRMIRNYNKVSDFKLSFNSLYATSLGRGRIAIEKYLHGAKKKIDSGIRKMARLDPTFLPEAATTSAELALHFLTSNEGNVMCGYHSFKNKASYARDGWGKPSMKVRGVPGKRKVATSEQWVKHDPKGLANCGCRIHDVLLEFALSKLISISGFVDGDR